MNIARLPAAKKKEVWTRLQDRQPDIALFIKQLTTACKGEYLVIDVSKLEDRPEHEPKNIWEGCGLKIK